MRIIGVDSGLRITGYGIIETNNGGYRVLDAGLVKSQKLALDSRVNQIHNQLAALLKKWGPDVLILEEIYSHYKHPRTSILMAHARGVVCLAASQANIPVIGYSATRVKKAIVGIGNASKLQVQRMVQRLLRLRECLIKEDISDALALALTHAYISCKDDLPYQRNT